MKYTRLAVVAILFVGLILWLRQCTSADDSSDLQGTLDNLKKQTESNAPNKTDGGPTSTPVQTQKP